MEEAKAAYHAGQQAFERGLYRESVTYLLQARALTSEQSALGGNIQLWLVNAFEANGQRDEARALCRQLCQHSDHETRRQSRRLLYILEAPQLQLKPEWLTQIPDLENPTSPKSVLMRQSRAKQAEQKPAPAKYEIPSLDESHTDALKNNEFLWIALGICAMTVLGLWWFSQSP